MKRLRIASLGLLPLAASLLAAPAFGHTRHMHPQAPLAPVTMPPRTDAPYNIMVDADPAHALNRFTPDTVFGAGVDGVPFHAVPEIYTHSNVRQMLGSGFGAVSYRLYTELSVQDWHWNPDGAYSEAHNRGYWTSSGKPGKAIVDTFGYRLPRRGYTHDEGNDDDYSRLDDGDPSTFWKSNPYLTKAYTGDADSAHPQWVLYDLGAAKNITAAKIWWGKPYAVDYAVQYWTGGDPIWDAGHGKWVSFPQGVVTGGKGGTVTLPLGNANRKTRFLRIVMTQSSGSCTTPDSSDPRDCAGYAIREAGFGAAEHGHFTDLVEHRPDQKQTVTYSSSVDLWHSEEDRVRDQEQPGLDIVFRSGLARGIPATVPIPMLYSTPANAAAEIRYLEARGYPIARVEMGEEPDGQFVAPEDYAALYAQFADAIHAVDRNLQLGGPVFEDNRQDWKAWPESPHGETSWVKRFVAYLTAHDHLNDLTFFSFEHYPFATCKSDNDEADLLREPGMVSHIVSVWRDDNLPSGLPMFITETNFSQKETDAAQRLTGGLWYAEMMGSLLSAGANGAFFYEYEPIPLSRSWPCSGWGSYGALEGNRDYKAQAPLSQYFAAQMLSQSWAVPGNGTHVLFPASTDGDSAWVIGYPLQRPDGRWSLLLVNRDFKNPHDVTVQFNTTDGAQWFSGDVQETELGPQQYGWQEGGKNSHPHPDRPPSVHHVSGGEGRRYNLPPQSLVVLTGSLSSR
ncbi:MAG: discoidin domain-containing protein [Alphaproteobacteria bacterium]|nr:discoidin domain-containing protein [Alphaproteobacteria bacterium]